MSRRFVSSVAVFAFLVSLAVAIAPAARSAPPGQALARSPELSVATRLADRREVDAGTRAYSIGFEDGRFYANGWHTTGEMGGIWTPPVKLLDGVWFGLDGNWIGPATRFSSGWGYTRFDLPTTAGLSVQRTDFVPDGKRGVLFGLTISNPGASRSVTLSVDAHSELMGQYPWGFSTTPNASENLPDKGTFDGRNLVFTDDGALSVGPVHHYAAVVGMAGMPPSSGAIGNQFYGPQPGHRCTGNETGAPADPKPSACDDGPFGRGIGGELTYRVQLPTSGSRTVWLGVAGSDTSLSEAQQQLSQVLVNPAGQLATKVASRTQLAQQSSLSLPGDPDVQQAVDWGKQNLADLTLSARNLQVRWTNQGKQFPAPLGTVPSATWIGAGYPDYPWIFGTDGEYTAFAAVSVGQFQAIEDHLRALRDISDILNNRSGVVVHESVSDGSIWYGHDSQTNGVNDFNTDETVKFPSAVALVWRWTGDNKFRDEMYDFNIRALRHVVNQLDADNDGWPEGSGNIERTGMGPEKLDNAVYLMRGLYDLADMARSKGDTATYSWAVDRANDLAKRFDSTWWNQAAMQYSDSLSDPGNVQLFQQYWIGQTPMEAELHVNGQSVAGAAPFDHGNTALAGRENSCFSGTPPFNTGLFHTGCTGPPNGSGEKVIFGLGTSIQAVGEGNYGRLGPDQQGRYLNALTQTMFGEPATGGTPDEQPGAMPEIFPSPDQGANIDRCWTCRSMFMQAWGHYGTTWGAVHQWLGVDPDLGNGMLSVVPQVPDGQSTVQGRNILLGSGSADVRATHTGSTYSTQLSVSGNLNVAVVIGHTLPRGTTPTTVLLDGQAVHNFQVTTTNRGTEVTVPTSTGTHTLTVTT
ncbi:MAG TPA: hypothetical protein VKB37_07625 [Jatrophihabitantaceae bacterium]|nr:hypothetical protein [Jatrophihabitantaceae bacterium]